MAPRANPSEEAAGPLLEMPLRQCGKRQIAFLW